MEQPAGDAQSRGGLGGTSRQEDRHRESADNGEQKIVPNIGNVFRRGQNLYVDFDVYDAAPDPEHADARRVAVMMSLFNQKGEKAFEVGPVKATKLVGTRPNAVPVQIQFPLKGLAPGHYVCQLNVIDEVGRKFAFRGRTW